MIFFSKIFGLTTKELFVFSYACKTVLTGGLRSRAGKCSFKEPVQCKGKNEWKSSPEYRKMIWKEIPLGCQPSSAVANTEWEHSKTFPKTTAACPRFDAWHVKWKVPEGLFHTAGLTHAQLAHGSDYPCLCWNPYSCRHPAVCPCPGCLCALWAPLLVVLWQFWMLI